MEMKCKCSMTYCLDCLILKNNTPRIYSRLFNQNCRLSPAIFFVFIAGCKYTFIHKIFRVFHRFFQYEMVLSTELFTNALDKVYPRNDFGFPQVFPA